MNSWPDYCDHKYQLWREGVDSNEYHCVKCTKGIVVRKDDWGPETTRSIQQLKDTNAN